MKKSKFKKSALIFSSFRGHRHNVKHFCVKTYKENIVNNNYHQGNSKHQAKNNFKKIKFFLVSNDSFGL